MAETIRVFVACAPNFEDAESQAVLEWSIRKNSSLPVEITWMHLSNDPESPFYGWDTSDWPTPFSGLRWAIPELCEFQGKAIYCDSDFIFLSDIAELWNQKIGPGKVAIGKGGHEWRMCCCMFDCEKMAEHVPSLASSKGDPAFHKNMNKYMRAQGIVQTFEGDWNNLDARNGESLADIDALHYTRMATQPQLEYALPRLEKMGLKHWFDGKTAPHPREDIRLLFAGLLADAAANGYTVNRYMKHEPFGDVDKRSFKGR